MCAQDSACREQQQFVLKKKIMTLKDSLNLIVLDGSSHRFPRPAIIFSSQNYTAHRQLIIVAPIVMFELTLCALFQKQIWTGIVKKSMTHALLSVF